MKHKVHPRELFLWGSTGLFLGVYLGIGYDWSLLLGMSSLIMATLSLTRDRKTGVPLAIITTGIIGIWYFIGTQVAETRYAEWQEGRTILRETKGKLRGTLIEKINIDETSITYRLLIDNFDTTSTCYQRLPDEENHIFVEIPRNRKVDIGEQIITTVSIQRLDDRTTSWGQYQYKNRVSGRAQIYSFESLGNDESAVFSEWKKSWKDRIEYLFPKREAGVILGMTNGDESLLMSDIESTFRLTGLTHILVVSGSNIALMILLIQGICRIILIPRTIQKMIIIAGLMVYSSIVGWDIPVIRASIMGILGYLIITSGSRANSLSLFTLAILCLTALDPYSIRYDVSFWLSFWATFGILLVWDFSRSLRSRCSGVIRPFLESILLTLGASIGTLPVIISTFGVISLTGLIINPLIAPIVGWIVTTWLLAPLISMMSETLWYIMGYLVFLPTYGLIEMAQFFASYGIMELDESTLGWLIPLSIALLFLLWIVAIDRATLRKDSTYRTSEPLWGPHLSRQGNAKETVRTHEP